MKLKPSRIELYRELVPLSEAAAVAYHIITDHPVPLKDPRALEEVRERVAIALTTVAPVLRRDNGAAVPLSAAEASERLLAGGGRANLDDLCMRRVDLLRAVEALKEAHLALDRSQAMESVRHSA